MISQISFNLHVLKDEYLGDKQDIEKLNASCWLIFKVPTVFPQLMEISIKITIALGGGVSINFIYYTMFSKVLCFFFCQIPSPYQICK